MITELPLYITIFFGLVVIGCVLWFYLAGPSRTFLLLLLCWILLQSVLGWAGLYREIRFLPPRIVLFGFLPALIAILVSFYIPAGREFIDRLDLKTLTWFHSLRIPVEIVLWLLFQYGLVSIYMTAEGTNFDLLSGLSAPVVGYLAFRGGEMKRQLLIWWNIICLLLLFNVVITAIFALPTPFQLLSPKQPNVAVLYFPFNLLPTVVVPLVLMAHLAALRKLMNKAG